MPMQEHPFYLRGLNSDFSMYQKIKNITEMASWAHKDMHNNVETVLQVFHKTISSPIFSSGRHTYMCIWSQKTSNLEVFTFTESYWQYLSYIVSTVLCDNLISVSWVCVLLTAVTCLDYTASRMAEQNINMMHWQTMTRENKSMWRKTPSCTSFADWLGTEPRPPQWENCK